MGTLAQLGYVLRGLLQLVRERFGKRPPPGNASNYSKR